MRAIISSAGTAVLTDVPRPSPGQGEVLVRVKANSLNRADLMTLKDGTHGAFGASGFPIGLEWAGEVLDVGAGVEDWRVGDRAMAAGQTVLIQGASSAMGVMGMQVAKHLGAAMVIGTSMSPERRARLAEFGADVVVDTGTPDWVAQVLSATGGEGVDLLIDLVAGPLVNGSLQATRIGGCMVNVGRMAEERGEFDFDLHSLRRITYVGVTFRTRSPQEVEEVVTRAARALGPALEQRALRMPIDKVYRLEEIVAAFEHMARNKHFGKIVLTHA